MCVCVFMFSVAIVKDSASTPDFRGFVLQAVTPGSTTPLGTFSPPGGTRQILSCSGGQVKGLIYVIYVGVGSNINLQSITTSLPHSLM